MPSPWLLDRLADAGLAFAHFNACRTSALPSASICRGSTRSLLHLTDSRRPRSAYYNRAVAKPAGMLRTALHHVDPALLGEAAVAWSATRYPPSGRHAGLR